MTLNEAVNNSTIEALEDEFYYWYEVASHNCVVWDQIERHNALRGLEQSASKYVRLLKRKDDLDIFAIPPLIHALFSLFPVYNDFLRDNFEFNGFRVCANNNDPINNHQIIYKVIDVLNNPDFYLRKTMHFVNHVDANVPLQNKDRNIKFAETFNEAYSLIKEKLENQHADKNFAIALEYAYKKYYNGSEEYFPIYNNDLPNTIVPYAVELYIGENAISYEDATPAEKVLLEALSEFAILYNSHEHSFNLASTNLERIVTEAANAFNNSKDLTHATIAEILSLSPYIYTLILNDNFKNFNKEDFYEVLSQYFEDELQNIQRELGSALELYDPIWLHDVAYAVLPELNKDEKILWFLGKFEDDSVDELYNAIVSSLPDYSGKWVIYLEDNESYTAPPRIHKRLVDKNDSFLEFDNYLVPDYNEYNSSEKLKELLEKIQDSEEALLSNQDLAKIFNNLLSRITEFEYKHTCVHDTVNDADNREYELPCESVEHFIVRDLTMSTLKDFKEL